MQTTTPSPFCRTCLSFLANLVTSSLLTQGPSLQTHLVVQASAPSVTGLAVTPGSGHYGAGTVITFTVTFSVSVTVTGTPFLVLNDGSTAIFVSGSGTTKLVFTNTVVAGQNAANLIVQGLTLPAGAQIFDVAGNYANVSNLANSTTGIGVDTTPPTIATDTANPAAGKYGTGQVITITVTGSEPLAVTGTPTLTLSDGGTASYISGSGTAKLAFSYTILAGRPPHPSVSPTSTCPRAAPSPTSPATPPTWRARPRPSLASRSTPRPRP